jgi:hypothetical protein
MRDRDKWWQFLRGAPESVWNPPKRPKVDKERRRQHGRDRPHEDVLGPWTPVNPAPYSNQIVKEEPVTYEGDWQPEAPHGYGRAAFTVPDSYSVATNGEAAAGPSIVKTEQTVLTRYIPPRPTPILLKEIDSVTPSCHPLFPIADLMPAIRPAHPDVLCVLDQSVPRTSGRPGYRSRALTGSDCYPPSLLGVRPVSSSRGHANGGRYRAAA